MHGGLKINCIINYMNIPYDSGALNRTLGLPGGHSAFGDGWILCVFHSETTASSSACSSLMKQNLRHSLERERK